MITAALTAAFIWSLNYGKIPQPYLLPACVAAGITLALIRRHKYTQIITIDVLAQSSRLRRINPTLKFWTLLTLMTITIASGTVYTGLFLIAAMLVLAVLVGGAKIHQYINIIALPLTFVLIGGLALLYEISPEPTGILSIKIFGAWLTISEKAQSQTALTISRAFGAVSCLNLLSITTPMPDIIAVLHRARCPEIIVDLMYLIYRYIFILLTLHHEMRNAAKSRLGFKNYRTSLRATGKIYANLLARSYQYASKNFDAMESRCYDTGIKFLQHPQKTTHTQIIASSALILTTLYLSMR